ncbi:MAG: hypothetical protein Hyperionvirus20_42 [Hyperionvirus sp.]|uniref:Uncharacterized protein n=1 Tax=Hyperionvirus sp. TaxID=2487770 RepID=A0A3G5ACE9_9VIRU|nr:MAG: hypothetical protein Hyperionvirus20_42 [Hyperionvirus sp.]
MSIANELDDLAKSYKLTHLKSEYEHYKHLIPPAPDKLEQLDKAIKSYEVTFKGNKNKIQDAFSKIDKYVYMKPWKKLPNFHKNVKLREYVAEHHKNNKLEVEKLLMAAVETNEHKINSSIVYDQTLCKILEVPILKEHEGKFSIETPKKISRVKKSVSVSVSEESDT